MLVVISKIISSNSRTESFNLYHLETREVSNWTLTEIKKALESGCDIRGFVGRNLRLNHYFSNIGTVGEKLDERQHYTAVKRNIYSNKTTFKIVDVIGREYEFEKSELIRFMKNGAIVAGVKQVNDVLKVSSSVVTEFIR